MKIRKKETKSAAEEREESAGEEMNKEQEDADEEDERGTGWDSVPHGEEFRKKRQRLERRMRWYGG